MLGIGGNYAGSEALAAMLGDDRPFFSLEMPGLANQDVPKASIEDIVARLRAEIHALSIGERCILLGACAGAFVVYELARRLAADGFAVEHVIMLDPPPSGPERARRLSSFDRWRQLAVPRFIAARVWLTLRTFVALDKSQRAAFLRQKMAVAREIVARRDLLRESRIEVQVTRVREAASAALTKFVPSAYGGRVTLIMGERRPPAEARTAAARWAALCTGSFDTAYVPGKNSGLMLKSPNVEVVASRMRTLLAEH